MNNDELQWRAVEEVRGQLCDQIEVVQLRLWEQSAKQVSCIVRGRVWKNANQRNSYSQRIVDSLKTQL